MEDGGSNTISTDSASVGHGSGSDAVVHMGDLLPHVSMDAPPSNLAAELDSMLSFWLERRLPPISSSGTWCGAAGGCGLMVRSADGPQCAEAATEHGRSVAGGGEPAGGCSGCS